MEISRTIFFFGRRDSDRQYFSIKPACDTVWHESVCRQNDNRGILFHLELDDTAIPYFQKKRRAGRS